MRRRIGSMAPARHRAAGLEWMTAAILVLALGCGGPDASDTPGSSGAPPTKDAAEAGSSLGNGDPEVSRSEEFAGAMMAVSEEPAPAAAQSSAAPAALPRLVDLGRDKCIPCKQMAPILEELSHTYRGRAEVEVIDISKDAESARKYAIRVIPTQIFFDAAGVEVWRHEGFLPRETIVAKFAEMGVAAP